MLAGFSKSKRRESEELESLELAMPLVPANAPIPVAAAAPAEVTAVPVSSEVSALPVDSGHPCATTISPPVVMGVPILESSDGPYCKCASAVWQDRPVAAAVPAVPAVACAATPQVAKVDPAPAPASAASGSGIDLSEAEMRSAEREARELERRELAALGAAAKNASEGEAAEDAAIRAAFSVASIQDRNQLRCISAPVGRMYPRELSVTCPPGVGAGATILVHSPDGRLSHVVVPSGVTAGGVFGVPIPPTELQLAYERELENQAKEEEDSKPRAGSGYEVSEYKIADYETQDYKVSERARARAISFEPCERPRSRFVCVAQIPEYKSVYED